MGPRLSGLERAFWYLSERALGHGKAECASGWLCLASGLTALNHALQRMACNCASNVWVPLVPEVTRVTLRRVPHLCDTTWMAWLASFTSQPSQPGILLWGAAF